MRPWVHSLERVEIRTPTGSNNKRPSSVTPTTGVMLIEEALADGPSDGDGVLGVWRRHVPEPIDALPDYD